MSDSQSGDWTRRDFLKIGTSAVASSVVSLPARSAPLQSSVSDGADTGEPEHAEQILSYSLNVNGQKHAVSLDTRTTLLDALREEMHLTGTKKGCDHGQCGACTVMVNGVRTNSCLTLAVMHQSDSITTIEGLGSPEALHPMQAAFIKHDGFQCGYCTSGQICSAVAVLKEIRAGAPSHVSQKLTGPVRASRDEIRERMSGNICRCGGYSNIVDAIVEVAQAEADLGASA